MHSRLTPFEPWRFKPDFHRALDKAAPDKLICKQIANRLMEYLGSKRLLLEPNLNLSGTVLMRLLLWLFLFVFSLQASAFTPCRIPGYPYAIECLSLQLESPVSKKHVLKVTVFKVASRVRYPKPSPVIWIPDGISQPASQRATFIINSLSKLRNRRDILWLEFSPAQESLDPQCGKKDARESSVMMRLNRFDHDDYLHQCRAQLGKLGSLDEVSEQALAKYYEAVANVLELKQVTIFAERSGAAVASAWQTHSPGRILFQVWDNPVISPSLKTQIQSASQILHNVHIQCMLSKQCPFNAPEVESDLNRLFERLPVTLTVRNPLTYAPENIILTAPFLSFAVLQMLNSPFYAQQLPNLLHAALSGDFNPFYQTFASQWTRRKPVINDPLYLAEQCMPWIRSRDAEQVWQTRSRFEATMFEQIKKRYQKLCTNIDMTVRPPSDLFPQTSALVLSGQSVHAVNLSNIGPEVIHLVVPGIGNSALAVGCTKDVITRYFQLKDAAVKQAPVTAEVLEADCLTHIPPPLIPRVAP